MKRRFFAMLLSLAMLFTLAPTAFAAENGSNGSQSTEMRGNCGATGNKSNVKWELTKNNEDNESPTYTLTISGSGDMMDWKDHSKTVDDTHCGNASAESGDTSCEVNDCMLSRPWQNYIDNITKVVVGDGITSIGSDAFNGLKAVTEVVLPDSLTQIGFGAFCRTAITEMTIPEKVSKLGFSAFYGCGSLEKVSFAGNELKEIEVYTFANCSKLETLQIPDGITTFGTGAVERCNSLKELVFPASVTTLGVSGLASYDQNNPNTSLERVVVKGTVAIPNNMFANCTALKTVDLCNTVTSIETRAFSNCSSLKSVDGMKAVTTIGDSAFRDCTKLESIQFGSDLVTVANYAFDHTNLSKVTLPASVTRIGGYGFSNIANLKEIVFEGTVAPEFGENAIANDSQLSVVDLTNISDFSKLTDGSFVYWTGDWNDQFTVFYVKDTTTLEALKEKRTQGAGCAYAVAGEGVEFQNCEKGKLATPVRAGYTFVGWYESAALSGDTVTDPTAGNTYYAKWNIAVLRGDCGAAGNEKNVHWVLTKNTDETTYTLTISGTGAMADYKYNITRNDATQPWRESQTGVAPSDISKVVVDNGVTNIGKFACNGLNHVKEYDIAATVQTISSWGIDTQSVEKFTLNGNKNFIVDADGVLMNAARDTMIAYPGGKAAVDVYKVPASVKKIDSGAFVGCDAKKIIVPNTVKSFPAWSLSAATTERVVFDAGVESIGNGTFAGADKLSAIEFGETAKTTLKELNNASLSSLPALKSIELPDSLVTIGNQVFGNTPLTEITIPDNVTSIGNQAFKIIDGSEPQLRKVTFGKTMPTLGNQIFLNQKNLAAIDMTRCTNVETVGSEQNFDGGSVYQTVPTLYVASENAMTSYKTVNSNRLIYAITNGGTFPDDTQFEAGKLATPVKDGCRFDGWYKNSGFAGNAVTVAEAGQTYYAKWEVKAEKTAPAVPTLKDRNYTSITLNTIEGAQYRCNGVAWQTSPKFTGLTAGTTYTFEAYYPETADCKASPTSEAVEFSTLRHSSGSSSNPTYSVTTPSKSENGGVAVSTKNARKGDAVTVTVTPDAGYQLDKLTVTDKNGNVLKLTDKGDGKYSFTMPDGKVEVKAVFAKKVETRPFVDVSADAYYNQAVQWAQEKGITDGISSDLFGPKQPCTRSQIVTFLWRAAGSPEPKSTAAGMTDVAPGSYYAKAVAWAVENGITSGTAEGTFSPDATCTRAQAVTFLARAQNAKATGKTAFSDVPADSYFADAVAWAQANGVTTGTSETTFSPDNDCTRAQIVTFLYRANQGT